MKARSAILELLSMQTADQVSTHRHRSANPTLAREVGTLRCGVGSSISLEAELHPSRLAQPPARFADLVPVDRSFVGSIPTGPTARSIMGAVRATTGWDRVP